MEEEGEESWHLQREEILLLMSVYCREDECVVTSQPDPEGPAEKLMVDALCDLKMPPDGSRQTFQVCVKLDVQTNSEQNAHVLVQFSLPSLYPTLEPPAVSITSDCVSSEDLVQLAKRLTSHSRTLLPQPCLLDILTEIKDEIMRKQLCDPMHWSAKRANVQSTIATNQNTNSAMPCQLHPHVTRLDHMRNERKYFKLLHSWAGELEVVGKVLKLPGRHGIYTVMFGKKEKLTEFMRRWKTQNVDVDSRGKPCREKLMSILYQEPIECNTSLCAFEFMECSKMNEVYAQFPNEKVRKLLNRIMPT